MTLFALVVISLILVIPALVVVGAGAPVNVADTKLLRRRTWIILLLLVAVVLLLAATLSAPIFGRGNVPLILLWLFPALEGVLALILIYWRDVFDLWKSEKFWISALLLALITLLLSLGRFISAWYAPLVITFPAVLMALAWLIGRRLRETALILLAVLISVYLLLDASGLVSNPVVMMNEQIRSIYALAGVFFAGLALALSAILVYRALNSDRPIRLLIPALLLLLCLAATEVRHGMIVEATGRAAEDHFPFFTILLSILAGMLVAGQYRGENQLVRLAYLVLVPVMIAGSYAFAWLFNPQTITQARADRLASAIERYHENQGTYPENLSDLTPAYLPIILGPLTGRGQIWCYQAGEDYYRLGYAYFQRYYQETFPTPYSEIKIPHSLGEAPAGPWICDEELERNQTRLGL
jgi:hypothetical protein